jgi:phosphoketolase
VTDRTATEPLTRDELRLIDAYWRAANYLSVGQIFQIQIREPASPVGSTARGVSGSRSGGSGGTSPR